MSSAQWHRTPCKRDVQRTCQRRTPRKMDVRRTLTSNPMQDGCAAHHDILETHEPSPVTSPSSCTVSAAALHWLLVGWPAAPQTPPLFQRSSYPQHNQRDLSHLGTTALYRRLPRTHPQCITSSTNLGPSPQKATPGLFPQDNTPSLSQDNTPRPTHSQPPTGTPPTSGGRHIGDWGVRAGARESPGRPLGPGRPPSQGPPRVVPDEAAAPWSRTSPAPRLRQSLERHKEEEEARG